MTQYELNARHLLCPLPVIRTQDRVKNLRPGDILTVWATDPGVMADIPAWCRINGHQLLTAETVNQDYKLVLQIGA